jgi:adenosine deaminase
VVGIDLAGTEKNAIELMPTEVERYKDMYHRAREAGLGTTVHTGETHGTGAEGVAAVVEKLQPDRIGHGIRSVHDERVLKLLRERGTVLELCPSSNLATHAVGGWREMKDIVRKLIDSQVKVTINTDGTYLLDTDMAREVALVRQHDIMSEREVDEALVVAREASFLD